MTQPPEDPHSAETQFGRPPLRPPPPPPPPPAPGWPQPGWPQPGWPPHPPPRKPSKAPWIVAAVVLVVLLAAGGVTAAVLLTGEDDGDDRASDRDPTSSTSSVSAPETGSATASGPVTSDAPTSEAPPPTDPDAGALVGSWSGTYECNQGASTVGLQIARGGDPTSLDATFSFGPTPENPEVPFGIFSMEGGYVDGVLTLRGTQWISQPPGYLLIDISADVADPATRTITGRVDAAGCSTFEITR